MPTLFEKPPQIPVHSLQPSEVLRQRHRWARWRGVLFTALIGLAVTFAALWAIHPSWHSPENWKVIAGIWAGGFFLTILAALVGWSCAPASLLDTAQQMDRDLTTKNRLEAAAALHGLSSPLARAQREETAAFLSREAGGVGPVRALPWLAAGVLVLILAHLVTLALWGIPALLHSATPAPVPPPPVKLIPKASIVWTSPEPESKANPIEEVPTVAVAQSTSGLKDLSLEISVDGTFKQSVPLPATPYDKPGKNTIKVSLYMDELDVQPFDVVSYFIRAQRITDQKVPDTTSAIQFIQVRKFRDDVTQVRGADSDHTNYALLIRLKLAELESVKENFILAHTDLPVTDPIRMKENERVGKNQGELSAKTEEVVQKFIQAGYPADMIDLLRQAEPPMTEASKKILATQNNEALPPQQKALSLIVEVEKFFIKVMADKGSAPPDDNPDDPFKDKQQHELKKRMALAAGQLEILAKNQTDLAHDLTQPNASEAGSSPPAPTADATANPPTGTDATPAQNNPPGTSGTNPDDSPKEIPLPPAQAVDPFGPDAGKGTFAQRQTRVVQGIETLLNGNTVLPPAVDADLQDARKEATESMHDLNQSDPADAKDPAAAAAQDLQNAIAEMNKAGEEQTKQAMEEGQQKLNDLAKQLRDLAQNRSPGARQKLEDLAQQVSDVRKQLEDAADQQQESGSAAGARRLNQLANNIANQKIAEDLSGMSKTGLDANKATATANKLEALAGQAAASALPGKPTAQDLANLINSLERSRANLARLAQLAGGAPPPQAGHDTGPTGQNPAPAKPGDQGPGKDDQGAGKTPASAGDPGAGKEPGKDTGQGQQSGQGQGQGQQPDAQKGPGEESNPVADQAAQGQGGGAQDNATAAATGGTVHNGPANHGNGSGGDVAPLPDPAAVVQGYRELIANLKDEAQMTKTLVPNSSAAVLMHTVLHLDEDTSYRQANPMNVVTGYQAIAAPLDQLLFELQQAMAHAQHDEIVKQPDLDDAPPAYRSAVSDYFETMSKDYHPDSSDPNAKKP